MNDPINNPESPQESSKEVSTSRLADSAVDQVVEVMKKEAAAIQAAANRVDASIATAIRLLFDCHGRVIVTGMGKMGCVARKAAATFCSTGTPAIFLHPSEAVHGDLGIVTENDVMMVLSNSGETRELLELLPYVIRLGVPVIGLTGNVNSSLAKRCSAVVDTGVECEADPIAVAPTSSTTVALAMSDALAVALMNRRGFTREQFAIFHPGGNLGGKLLIKVAEVMHRGDALPVCRPTDTLSDGIVTISSTGLGAVFVVSPTGHVEGVLTDGDLRRIIQQSASGSEGNVLSGELSKYMTKSPKSISSDSLAAEALRLMEDNGITVLPVVESSDGGELLVGVVHLHDLIRAGLA